MALASPFLISNSLSCSFLKPSKPTQTLLYFRTKKPYPLRFSARKIKATIDEANSEADTTLLIQEQDKPTKEVEESVKVLKEAAKTKKVSTDEILSAFSVLEKAKLDPSEFLETLGGTKSPGKTWMLVFTAEKGLNGGKYFPITAIQRFDAAKKFVAYEKKSRLHSCVSTPTIDLWERLFDEGYRADVAINTDGGGVLYAHASILGKRIENGVYLGSLGWLTFEGRLSWKKRILAFTFERIKIKIGPFNPFEVQFGGKEEREPSTKDPFFIWFYIDEEIAVARGRSGGTAFWVRCQKVPT